MTPEESTLHKVQAKLDAAWFEAESDHGEELLGALIGVMAFNGPRNEVEHKAMKFACLIVSMEISVRKLRKELEDT